MMLHAPTPSLVPHLCGRCGSRDSDPTWHVRPVTSTLLGDHGQSRRDDPETSHEAALRVRPGSARYVLLEAHLAHPAGLTDEEAAEIAGLALVSEYATRCSELVRAGYLVDTAITRTGASGMSRMVRRITIAGRDAL